MKLFSPTLAIIILALATSLIYSQETTSTLSPVEEDVVKISTTLVQVDVTVTDKTGKTVTDLKPEDFEIFADGKKQDITNFSLVSATTEFKQLSSTTTNTGGEINVINKIKGQRIIALVIDDLGLSAETFAFTKQSVKKFLDEQMQSGDIVAVTSTRRGIGTTLRFTSDKKLLYAALEGISWKVNGREEIDPSIENPERIKRDSRAIITPPIDTVSIGLLGQNPLQSISEGELHSKMESLRQSRLTILTLKSLMSVINAMKPLPGRKSVMFFSDGLSYLNRSASGAATNLLVLGSFQRVIDSATRASVVVNSVDAKGLDHPESKLLEDFRGKTDGLRLLADETGGLAFYNNNALAAGVEQTLRQQADYYLIGYQPDSDIFDTKKLNFNKLEIKLKRSNLNVRYKKGFFGVSDESKLAQISAQQKLTAHNSPFTASDINLRLNTFFGNDAKIGNYVRSLLHIDGKNLKFTVDKNGIHKTNLDIYVVNYGKDGQIVDKAQNNFTFAIEDKLFEKNLADGFIYEFLTPVKNPGVYEMRLVVRDTSASKFGSAYQIVEIPDLSKNKPVLSSIVMGNLGQSNGQVKQLTASETVNASNAQTKQTSDIVFRQFKKGSILSYGAELYNGASKQRQTSRLQTQIKILRDGKIVLEGAPTLLKTDGQNLNNISISGALEFGKEFAAGEYVLQINVIDDSAKEKDKVTTQSINFEITE